MNEIIYWMVWAASIMGPPPDVTFLEMVCLEKHPKARIERRVVPINVMGNSMLAELVVCIERPRKKSTQEQEQGDL